MTLVEFLLARLDEDMRDADHERRIIALHAGEHECVAWQRHSPDLTPGPDEGTSTVFVAKDYIHEADPTLRLLALPYADHADYRPEWALS